MPLLFGEGLIRTNKFDVECAILADSHYSRQSMGSAQFMPPGKTIVLRDREGTVVFGWLWQEKRDDGQKGYNCSIFRNESALRASDLIREASEFAWKTWGPNRLFTYIDPHKTRPIFRHGHRILGWSFRKAGWKPLIHKNGKPQVSQNGLHIFVKLRAS